jgi:rhodanese-related sulfurtransferase
VPPPRITREELKARLDSGAAVVIIDARLKYPYEHSTVKLPGALRVMGDDPLPEIPAGSDVVVYDSDPNELASSHLVARFMRSGIRAAALKGGIAEWVAGNLPVERKDAPKQMSPEPGALKS